MDNNGLEKILKMYDKLNYFDQYGGSVILFVIITILVFVVVSYFFTMANIQPIIDDWPNQRCNLGIIPFAGYITHPEGTTASEYTYENFNYCTQNILAGITGTAVQPITYATKFLQTMAEGIGKSIQNVRGMFSKVRDSMNDVAKDLMGRLINITVPLQQMIISFRDLIGKIQGTMTGGLFTLLGSYYTLKSLMGAIAQFLVIILIALAVMVAAFWILPFTWGFAIANTAIFVAISIPFAIILAFMSNVLKVSTKYSIPRIKCFDEDTEIQMNDGSNKKISEIKFGDVLKDNNRVTGIVKVTVDNSTIYMLDKIIVSDSHMVKHNGEWIKVSMHPNAKKYAFYDKKYLYCLNTESKVIEIGDHVFSDWDEIYGEKLDAVLKNDLVPLAGKSDIHKHLDGGFSIDTRIYTVNGERFISEIAIGDILINSSTKERTMVYGIVEIDGETLSGQYKYYLGGTNDGRNSTIIKASPHFICSKHNGNSILRKKEVINKKYGKLYHLLTTSGNFYIGNVKVYDYNASIDIFLEKDIRKILSMKYV